MMGSTQILFFGLLVVLLSIVALVDWQEQRIPNWLNLALAVGGLGYRLVQAPGFATLGTILVQAGLSLTLFVLTAEMIRWVNRGAYMGGGDLKFLVAVSLWVGLDGSVSVLLVASALQIAVVVAMIPWRGLHKNKLQPFGPMLALGTLGIVLLVFLRDGAGS